MSGDILLGLNMSRQSAGRYVRGWSSWPCRAEKDRIVPLTIQDALASPRPPTPYDPFGAYFAAKRDHEAPHYALARCGKFTSMDDLADLGERQYTRADKRAFFSLQGCKPEDALAFVSRWGLLDEGWCGAQGEIGVPENATPLWEFRSHAAYVWGLLQLWQAIRKSDEHNARLLLPACWWLAGNPNPLPPRGPLPGIRRLDRGPQELQRIASTFPARAHWKFTQVQRAAQLLDSLLNIEMAGVRPRTTCSLDAAGKPGLTASLTTDTLRQAILAMVYLDVTREKDMGECALLTCAKFFNMGKRQRTAEAQGQRVYCCHEHAVRAASLRSTDSNRERVRAQARERQRKHRAKLSQKPVRGNSNPSRTSRRPAHHETLSRPQVKSSLPPSAVSQTTSRATPWPLPPR